MHLVRWEPFRELHTLRRRMDRLFNDFATDVSERSDDESVTPNWVPTVDVFEGDSEITLRAELPGLAENDVEITVDNGRLTVRGEKKLERDEGDGQYRRIESRYGAFYRSFPLPDTVDSDKIEAGFDNGVLEIALPKAEAAKPKRIDVKTS